MSPRRVSASRGLQRTLKAIDARLDESHAALVALARGLAAAVDAEPGNAALWREYRAAVVALSQVATGGEVDDDTAAFLVAIRTPTLRRGEDGS